VNTSLVYTVETDFPPHYDKYRARTRAIAQWHEQALAAGVKPLFNATISVKLMANDDNSTSAAAYAEVEVIRN
jgi:hypothetical protein